jgi:hypothetical protein
MAQSLDIYIDTTNGNLVAAGSARNGTLPTLTRNDSYNLRVRLQERDTSGFLRDLDLTGSSIKLGIGGIDADPTDGQFQLVLNSITSSAISFNATTTQVYNAISAIASSGVGVTTYGNENFAYLITSPTLGTAMSFGGDAFTLFPTSSVLVSTRRFPTALVSAQQVIRLVRNPAVYSDTFVASPTAGVVSLTKVQDGSSTKNETYDLAIGSDAEGGSVVLNYGTNSTTAIPIGATAASFQEALTSITAISNGNVSVDIGNNAGNYSISFVRNLGLTNITTALTLDASGVIFGNFLQTTVTMATAELDELFAEAGTDTISPKIEVELTQNGTPKTVLQTNVTVRRDLITTGSAVPAAQASYLTAAESYAAFVRNSTTGVDSTNRTLFDSGGAPALDWENRLLADNNFNAVVSFSTGVQFNSSLMGFYGATVTAQPSGTNIVSGLTNLGLLSYTQPTGTNIVSSLTNIGLLSYTQPTSLNVVSSLEQTGLLVNNNTSTFGVFPLSSRTLTTVTFFGPVTVGGNDVNSTTVSIVGVQPNDICMLGLPTDITEGITFFSHCVTAGQVHIDLLNVTGGQKIQTAATYRVTVIGY